MSPGSSWSQSNGFEIVSFDYSNKDAYLLELLERYNDKLETQYRKEAETLADFELFRSYFEDFMMLFHLLFVIISNYNYISDL